MATSICQACRVTSRRLGSASSWRTVSYSKGLMTTRRCAAASNFPMPAMSPTMTEGTISSWKIKEGDKFAAGDVLLEIETDKAQMDVEAQEDGLLAKITVQAGKSPIKVGTRIAVLAESGDDLQSLEIPPDDSPPADSTEKTASPESPKESESPQRPATNTGKETKSDKKDVQPGETQESSKEAKESFVNSVKEDETTDSRSKNPFIASPGIEHLLHMHGLQMTDVKGTGPKGRVLKGDVLAYLGEIDKSKPKEIAQSIAKLSKLDLSNIKVKKTEAKPATKKEEAKKAEELPKMVELKVQVSLAEVFAVQKKLKDTINVTVPISSFIARATQRANQNLPKSKLPPTPDDLFNQILGAATNPSPSAIYIPEIASLTPTPPSPPTASAADIFDVLLGISPSTRKASAASVTTSSAVTPVNFFSLKVSRSDEERGMVFLGKLKASLEYAPEELIV